MDSRSHKTEAACGVYNKAVLKHFVIFKGKRQC